MRNQYATIITYKGITTTKDLLCKAIEVYKGIGNCQSLFIGPKRPKRLVVANPFTYKPPNLNNSISIIVVDFILNIYYYFIK
jgi:hypothetical protein